MMAVTATFAHDKKHSSSSKDINPDNVSISTQTQFAEDFPGATDVHYAKSKDYDVVYFTSGKRHLKSYYDYKSELLGTTQNETFANLPENAQKKILKDYADYTIVRVIKFDAAEGEDHSLDLIEFGSEDDNPDNYYVELKNNSKAIVVKVDLSGDVDFFAMMR